MPSWLRYPTLGSFPSCAVGPASTLPTATPTPCLHCNLLHSTTTEILTALAAHASVCAPCVAHVHRGAGSLVRPGAIDEALLNIRGERIEGLVDVDVALCRDLEEGDPELIGEGLAALGADGTLLFPIALVADENLVDAFGGVLLDVGKPRADVCGGISWWLPAVQELLPAQCGDVTYC